MSFNFSSFSPSDLRTSITRIPLASKVILGIIGASGIYSVIFNAPEWLILYPDKIFSGGAHRLSTYPFVHMGIFHTIVNMIALVPLIEKFEEDNNTIVTFLLFFGPLTTLPGLLYTLLCKILHLHGAVTGASVWSFLLFSATIFQASKATPQIAIPATSTKIPTLAIPLLATIITFFLVPQTSFFAHLGAILVGFGWGSGFLKFLAPPDKITRWIEDKFNLTTRLPRSYVSVNRGAYGRYGLDDLPTNSGQTNGIFGSGD